MFTSIEVCLLVSLTIGTNHIEEHILRTGTLITGMDLNHILCLELIRLEILLDGLDLSIADVLQPAL